MPSVKLNEQLIKGLKSKDATREEVYRDTDTRGLWLEVHPNGRKTWVVWGRVSASKDPNRKKWRVKLGYHPELSLHKARIEAAAIMAAGRNEDPNVQRRRDKATGTFGELVDEYLEHPKGGRKLRPTTLAGWKMLLMHDRVKKFRALRTTEIERRHVIELVNDIYQASLDEGEIGFAANRTYEAVRRVFAWAVEEEKGGVTATPCTKIVKPVVEREHERSRSYSPKELGAIINALDDSAMSDAIRLCLYTGVRIVQALDARWADIDLANETWKISKDSPGNKSKQTWTIPLVDAAVDLLTARKSDSEFVFRVRRRKGEPGGDGRAWRSQRVIYDIRKKSGVDDFRPHDLRRCLGSFMVEKGIPSDVRDAVLLHRMPSNKRIYESMDPIAAKKKALKKWADHVARVAAAGAPGKILHMPSA
jgi:integrase